MIRCTKEANWVLWHLTSARRAPKMKKIWSTYNLCRNWQLTGIGSGKVISFREITLSISQKCWSWTNVEIFIFLTNACASLPSTENTETTIELDLIKQSPVRTPWYQRFRSVFVVFYPSWSFALSRIPVEASLRAHPKAFLVLDDPFQKQPQSPFLSLHFSASRSCRTCSWDSIHIRGFAPHQWTNNVVWLVKG